MLTLPRGGCRRWSISNDVTKRSWSTVFFGTEITVYSERKIREKLASGMIYSEKFGCFLTTRAKQSDLMYNLYRYLYNLSGMSI